MKRDAVEVVVALLVVAVFAVMAGRVLWGAFEENRVASCMERGGTWAYVERDPGIDRNLVAKCLERQMNP